MSDTVQKVLVTFFLILTAQQPNKIGTISIFILWIITVRLTVALEATQLVNHWV